MKKFISLQLLLVLAINICAVPVAYCGKKGGKGKGNNFNQYTGPKNHKNKNWRKDNKFTYNKKNKPKAEKTIRKSDFEKIKEIAAKFAKDVSEPNFNHLNISGFLNQLKDIPSFQAYLSERNLMREKIQNFINKLGTAATFSKEFTLAIATVLKGLALGLPTFSKRVSIGLKRNPFFAVILILCILNAVQTEAVKFDNPSYSPEINVETPKINTPVYPQEKCKIIKKAPETEKKNNQLDAYLKGFMENEDSSNEENYGCHSNLEEKYLEPLLSERNINSNKLREELCNMRKREEEFKSHYAFYHGHPGDLDLIYDTYTIVKNKLALKNRENYMYLRFFPTNYSFNTIQNFLDYKTSKVGSRYDCNHRSILLSVNFSPFGGKTVEGSDTLKRFLDPKRSDAYDPFASSFDHIRNLFSQLNFDSKYLDTLNELHKTYYRHNQYSSLVQILIPKSKVDDFSYVSLPGGHPALEKDAPIKTSQYLHTYTNNPRSIQKNSERYKVDSYAFNNNDYLIDKIQGRIVFAPGFFNEKNGIKIFRYDFIDKEEKREYREKLENTLDEVITDWIENKRYKTFEAKMEEDKAYWKNKLNELSQKNSEKRTVCEEKLAEIEDMTQLISFVKSKEK